MARHRPPAVGVDFGTSTSLVARRNGTGPLEILPIGETRRWLPSIASVSEESLVVGEKADVAPPELVIRSIKSAITKSQPTVLLETGDGSLRVSRDDVVIAILREVGI